MKLMYWSKLVGMTLTVISIFTGVFAYAPRALADPLPPDVSGSHGAASAVQDMIKTGIMKTQQDGKFHGAQPITRYELAVILDRFVNYIEQASKPIKQTLYPVPKSSITAQAGTPAYDAQVRLLRDGFISISSPLLQTPATGVVTAQELASIMAHVTIRLSDRHLSVTKDAGPVD